jgi:heme oxygenase (biliverdin-producing, ferredoxin)
LKSPLVHDLTDRLRTGTRDLHAQTERTGVMAALLAGRLSRPGYEGLLRNLHAIYQALEDAQQHPLAHPAVTAVNDSRLHRGEALAADLRLLAGADWPERLPLMPAAATYAMRLAALAQQQSAALVAHVYARYLGDLHGGQILKRLVAKVPGAAKAIRFYDFGDAAQVDGLRLALRQGLASLPVDAAEADAVVEEARWAFVQHQRLFEELASA